MTLADHWDDLVEVAMLGTDRRDPPEPVGVVADIVDDTLRAVPSERMLAQVAATVAIRRAGVLPGPPLPPLFGPETDERPSCPAAAVDRWHHLVVSWPVLEDEWMLAVIRNGWRLAPELVPDVLRRVRRDPVRRARALVAAGPLARWLVELCPELATTGRTGAGPTEEEVAELPALPIPPELEPLLGASDAGERLAAAIEDGRLVHAHRAVLVNLVARMRVHALEGVAEALARVGPGAPGVAEAALLADLATTRQRMLAELTPAAG